MKKLLYVSTSSTRGGAEKTLYTLATLLDPKLCQVCGVVSLKPKGPYAEQLERAGHRVYTLDVASRAGLRDLQKLALIIHETQPDVVHAIMYQAIQLCRAVRRFGYAEYRLISSPRVHYRTRGPFSLWIDGMLKSSDDMLITECEASRKYLVEKLGYDADTTINIHNGVDIAGWPISKKERADRRRELGLSDKDILLGAVGRLDEQKGHVYLLEAVAKLAAVHPVRCVIIGEGPLRKPLEAMISSLGLEGKAVLLGEQQDIHSWLSALDIFVLPSLWEGLPNSVLEAMAVGLPVVATEVDGVPEAISHEISGLLCKPNNAQALYVPIQDLIVEPALRQRLGQRAQQVVTENFKLMDMIQKYEDAYKKVLSDEEA
ncbi:MAG: glycosyltransferase [Elusimicrobiota bacterium]